MWDGNFGLIMEAKYQITLVSWDKLPIRSAPYRTFPRAREYEKHEIEKMLEINVIEPGSTEGASPTVFVSTKDETLLFCVIYRKLNAVTIWDSYPIPGMDECIDSLGDAIIFSTLDAISSYLKV